MKANNYSLNIHWDKRYPKAGTDLCPIQLAVNLSGLQFKVSLKLYSTKADYEKALNSKGGSDEVKELRRELNEYVSKAEKILERLPNPTREIFQRLFKSETDLFASSKTDVTFFFEEYMARLNSEERIKTAINLKSSLTSFKKYRKQIFFEDINEAWINGYKNFMLKGGNSATTVQIYLRNLRTIFNQAIKNGYISERHYPFKTYQIGSSSKSKSVLYGPQLKALWEYEGTTMREQRSRAYFFFLYLASGMNYKDMCYLQFKDLKADTLSFVREKTKRTTKIADKQIVVYLHEELKAIIEKWGNKPGNPDDFVFPILNGCKSAMEKETRRWTHQRRTNLELNTIGIKLGFEERLTTNLARHSFATFLKVSGTPIAFIGDALGHTSSKTTEHYMKSIPTDKARDISNTLLNFN